MLTTGRAGLFILWTLINPYNFPGLLSVGMRLCIMSLSTFFKYFRIKCSIDFCFEIIVLEKGFLKVENVRI